MSPSLLAVFDFDHTICEDNSDIVARKLIPTSMIPKSLKGSYKEKGWTYYMGKVFELLHENNVNAKQIKSAISDIPAVTGIADLILELHSRKCEIIIISDSNSVFIETWLDSHKLDHAISKIYTNPAKFDNNGMLTIQEYHLQDWCELSEKNICKGHILDSHVNERKSEGVTFDKVIYIGDGSNDLCPVLRLSNTDMAFPRLNHKLIQLIKDPDNKNAKKIECEIVPWESGHDILKVLKDKVFF